MTQYTHRIRRCNGNKKAWCLVTLRDDGSEMMTPGSYTTSTSLDSLLKMSGGLLPDAEDVVQIVYYTAEA